MADSKYANLSGIAYDQPDVYETSDLPEVDQLRESLEEESDAVEQLNINVPDAFSKFKGHVLSSENVDFSDRLGRYKRTGYGLCSGEWELVAAGEKETPLHKYQRLKCELKELMEEISSLKEDESKELPNFVIVSHLETMNRQLEELRLDKSLGTELVTNLADPQGAQIKKMLCELDKIGGIESESDHGSQGQTMSVQGQSGEVRYQVSSRPRQAQLLQSARLADLESRVARLNNVVSSSPDSLRRLCGDGDKSLTERSRWIAGKVALMEVSQLEAVDARMTSLLAKLDQLSERSSSLQDQERDNKISELYDLARTMEDMSQVLPRALDRMVALETLHTQGTGFVKSLAQLEATQQALNNSCETTKEALRAVEQNFAASVKAIKANLKQVDARIKALSEEKKKK
uniref:Putative dynactin subunit 2-like protein n=1 Tax=Triatoma dimidiata TaxID=72491 RepID=A0A0V0G6L5_TRIDM